MARQEMLMARCDRKECNTVIEIDRSTEAPEGWLQIRVEIAGKWDGASKLEFCSEKCVSIWARNRKNYQNGDNGRISSREIITAAIELQEGEQFDYPKIHELISDSGITENALRQMLSKLSDEGVLEIIKKAKSGSGERTIFKAKI